MERVAELVATEEYGQALVRLWILGGDTSRLNRWERTRKASRWDAKREELARALQSGVRVTATQIEEAPLAFIAALDEILANSHRAHRWHGKPYEEDGQRYWLVPNRLVANSKSTFSSQAGKRSAWFTRHCVIPARTSQDLDVVVTIASGAVGRFFDGLAADPRSALPVWIGHFRDDARLQLRLSDANCFFLTGIEPAATREASICETLARAADMGARVVLLPEFTVDLAGRRRIASWMMHDRPDHPFELIVAGSFHQREGDYSFNVAELWDRNAESILMHKKIRLYGARDFVAEDVGVGRQVTVLAGAIGRLMLLICKDFMDEDPSVASLVHEVPVDWVLVPSCGDDSTVKAHRSRAETLVKLGTCRACIVANQGAVELGGDDSPGFAVQKGCSDADPGGSLIVISV